MGLQIRLLPDADADADAVRGPEKTSTQTFVQRHVRREGLDIYFGDLEISTSFPFLNS